LQRLKLWTLKERGVCADSIEVYKITHGISSVSFDTFFKYNNYEATRGHLLKLMKKTASTELRHHFFSERVINIWNSLDNKTVTSGTINISKGNLERLRQSKRDRPVLATDATWSTETKPCRRGGTVSLVISCIHRLQLRIAVFKKRSPITISIGPQISSKTAFKPVH